MRNTLLYKLLLSDSGAIINKQEYHLSNAIHSLFT